MDDQATAIKLFEAAAALNPDQGYEFEIFECKLFTWMDANNIPGMENTPHYSFEEVIEAADLIKSLPQTTQEDALEMVTFLYLVAQTTNERDWFKSYFEWVMTYTQEATGEILKRRQKLAELVS
jgi:hypothetical protein